MPPDSGPESKAEFARLLRLIAERLTDDEIAIFQGIYLNEETPKELAERLQIKLDTLYKRLRRLEEKIKAILIELGKDPNKGRTFVKSPSDPPTDPSDEIRDPIVKRLADRVKSSSLPEARALKPLSVQARHALTDKLLGPLEEEEPQPAAEKESAAKARPTEREEEKKGGAVVRALPQRRVDPPRRRAWWPLALAAAMVLGVGFLWLVLRRPPPAQIAYHLRVEGDKAVRGDTPLPVDAPVRLRPSTRFLVALTPTAPIEDPTLRMLIVRDGKARLVRPPFESDGQGKLTIDKPARDALGDQVNGPAELVWLVGRAMPAEPELEQIALDPSASAPEGTTVLRAAAVFVDWGGASLSPRGTSRSEVASR